MLVDSHGRAIQYLRVSVTDRCNFRCRYCMPEEGLPLIDHDSILRFEEIAAFCRVAAREGIRTIRLTGGEPLVKRGIVRLVELLARIDGIDDLAMTTNGVLLASMASELRGAGLGRVNIGAPTLDPVHYREIARCSQVPNVVEAIQAALEAGLRPVKVNAVVLRGLSDALGPMLELARTLPIELRFIEYMPMGPRYDPDLFVPASAIRSEVARAAGSALVPDAGHVGRGPVSGALRGHLWAGTVAVIPAMSEHFCARCNRLRLTSDGFLRTCLFSDDELDLKPALRPRVSDRALLELLHAAVQAKPACMPLLPGQRRRLMGQVGG